jgi:hypothetical protein
MVGRTSTADRVRVRRSQLLHQADHVVAEITEHARRHRRQRFGEINAALCDQLTQGHERGVGTRNKSVWISAWRAVDFGTPADRAPDQIRLKPDDRVAATHGASFDRLQEKAMGPAAGDF